MATPPQRTATPPSQPRLHKIDFVLLKNLTSFTLDLEQNSATVEVENEAGETPIENPKGNNVTGIFGVNGCGKSSILYAILCLFKPTDANSSRRNFKFSQFFTHTTHSNFKGSSFKITHSFRVGANEQKNIERLYSKVDRWKPRYDDRPQRDVYFIGIDTCVPEIEVEKSESLINFSTRNLIEQIENTIKSKAAYILNRTYSEYNKHRRNDRRTKEIIGVKHNNILYSSLSMGAGEQRVFKILDIVFRAPKYSLIIIDEIDLTLHTEALNRLIEVIVERASTDNIQIIFTSHREELTQRTDINVRHIHQVQNRTLCFNETNPDCIARLTGVPTRILEIFVEDDLASSTVQKVIGDLGIHRHCAVKKFGAMNNAFTLAIGLVLKNEDLSNTLILLDGDVERTHEEKKEKIRKLFVGNEIDIDQKRIKALSCIKQLILPENISPEQHIHSAIGNLDDGSEIANAMHSIQTVNERHDYVNNIVSKLGYEDKKVGLSKIVDKLAATEHWQPHIEELQDWLENRISELHLN